MQRETAYQRFKFTPRSTIQVLFGMVIFPAAIYWTASNQDVRPISILPARQLTQHLTAEMELGGKAQEPIARSRTFYLGGVGVGDAQHTIAKGPLLIRVHYNLYTTWRSYTSNTLAQLDSNLAARSYDGAQESVCRSSL